MLNILSIPIVCNHKHTLTPTIVTITSLYVECLLKRITLEQKMEVFRQIAVMRHSKRNEMTRKNKESKNKLSAKQIKELKKIIGLSPKFHVQGKLGDFFDNYLLCEVTARKIIFFKTGKTSQNLYIKSIKSAAKHYFPSQNTAIPIDNIFLSGNKSNRNNKSCRQLRNGYIHSLSKEDRNEIESRIIDLKADMQKWINLFI